MRALDFLDLVWPKQGHYCITTPRKRRDNPSQVYWAQKVFNTSAEAVEYAHSRGHLEDQYFAVLSLREPFIIDAKKREKAIKEGWQDQSGKVIRVKENMAWARCFMMDIDVGENKVGERPKYPTQSVAFEALKAFLKTTGLPRPWLVSSGYGIHAYWPLTEDVPADQWRPIATKLKQLCAYHDFRVDPSRTADASSVLRVPGTMNLKRPESPQKVRVLKEGDAPHDFAEFTRMILRAGQLLPTGEKLDVAIPESLKTPQAPVKPGRLAKACAQVRYLIEHPNEQTEPSWYKLLGVIRFCVDGRMWAHKVSEGYGGYDAEETDKKLDQLEGTTADGREIGPTTCGSFADTCGAERCHSCWFKKQTTGWEASSPIVAARRLPLESRDGLPDPPEPFTRVAGGIMRGGDVAELICPYDLYPVRLIDDPKSETKCTEWAVVIPRRGIVSFVVTMEEQNDAKMLGKKLFNKGVWLHFDELKWVRHYMTAYGRKLQEYLDDQRQHPHLGWTDDRRIFVMPQVEYEAGRSKPTMVTHQVKAATQMVTSVGSMEEQIRLLRFYDRADYLRHQFFVAASLASPLFAFTGHYGAVVSMAGTSGASKSTALYTGASLWGKPEAFAISGLSSGGTPKGKLNRAMLLSNLPFMVDEVTLMNRDEAKEMVMGWTQPGGRIIMDQTSTERKLVGEAKSALMLLTSNVPVHDLLSHQNPAGTAGSMRLFEIATPRCYDPVNPDYVAKRKADDYKLELNQNFGWIGPKFMEWVTAHIEEVSNGVRAEIARFDEMVEARQQERFWTAVAGVTMFTLKNAYRLKLLPYDPVPVERWLIDVQMGAMRGIINDNYLSSVEILAAYLAQSINNLLITTQTADRSTQIKEGFQGALAGQLDTGTKTVILLISALRSYAARERFQLNTFIEELEAKKIGKRIKACPGAGTMFSTGQHACLSIDLTHPALSGHERMDDVNKVVTLKR